MFNGQPVPPDVTTSADNRPAAGYVFGFKDKQDALHARNYFISHVFVSKIAKRPADNPTAISSSTRPDTVSRKTSAGNSQKLSSPVPSVESTLGAISDLYKKGDYASAAPLLQQTAKTGNSEIQFLLGRHYDNNYPIYTGVTKDQTKSVELYRQSAERGNSDAMLELGLNYFSGQTLPRNYEKAMHWIRKSADAGNSEAMNALGNMYSRLRSRSRLFASDQMVSSAAEAQVRGFSLPSKWISRSNIRKLDLL